MLDASGSVVADQREPTPRDGPRLLDVLVALAQDLIAQAGEVAGVGIGAPGLVDGLGTLQFAPNLPGVVGLAIGAAVADRLRAVPVVVDNDATCAGWAEALMGSAHGCRYVLMATLGTGIGGGLVVDGRVVRGAYGFAGEIGHTIVDPAGPLCPCGQRGCWERYASGSGLGWMGREAAEAGLAPGLVDRAGGDPENVRGEHVTAAARAGDAAAQEVMDRFGWWVALGLANLANILDPECIVVGGGLIEAGEVLLAPTRRAFDRLLEGARHRPAIPIVAAALGERAGAIGAALLARPSDRPVT